MLFEKGAVALSDSLIKIKLACRILAFYPDRRYDSTIYTFDKDKAKARRRKSTVEFE